ncbi:hypothetical protein GCM10020358_34650 [Amorphoplanes nipponensis]|uniref:Ig-like domain (Group 3) n=1 Tax=Actinoplanes nipponensis TaxID=135950 RepID=A0A919MRZ0_9ACTN|nr:hypothetical protein [Actinoplanes nipponensis]GIE52083.1 hypothetical protein Ani05nite_56170 [Actinoplanes nipponensis]
MSSLPYRALTVATAVALLVLPGSPGRAAEGNHPPATPASLTVGGIACVPGGILVGTTTPQVTASFADADLGAVQGETLTPQFAVWPVGAPAQRTAWSAAELAHPGTVFTTIPSTLVNGGRYRLTARATDAAGAVSAWSPVCTFTVDTTRPQAPTVTSADYPEGTPAGGVGITGKFTFAAARGDQDVVKFRYSSAATGLLEVPADRRGRAVVEITPTAYGTNVVTVQAIDRTGNRSAEATYSFTVIDHEPKVLDQNPDAGVGEPRTVRFWSAVPDTASFTYRLNDGPATTVAAGTDGYATVTVTPDRRGDNFLTITSRTASGIPSPEVRANLYVTVRIPRPEISSPDFPNDGTPPPTAGQQVTIVLRTDSPEVTEFAYSVDFGETQQVVAADENGNATLRHTTVGEYLEVQARARTADGFESDQVVVGWELTPAP